ncbi:ABC transporter permease, partial [Acinetobacter variabilis]|uniref:ABC transporter permease n=2 Tax=Moraxellaceae TaxID=468 RepID=UPI00289D28AD
MKSLWKAYCQTFKDIISNTSIFTTLILSVLFYSFFYPTAYKAEQAEALPIIIVDEEQSALTNTIISHVSQSPNVQIKAVTGNFAEAKHWVETQKADGILLLPDNLSQSIRHGENG